jgi:hypothetical protein
MNKTTKTAVVAVLVAVILTGLAGTGIVYAADASMPGDFLYGVDKGVEDIQRSLTSDPVASSELELAIMDERIAELDQLSQSGNSEAVGDCIREIEQQQDRLQDQLQEMNQLRTQEKIQTEEQQKVMEKLESKIQENADKMSGAQNSLQSKGDSSNSENLQQVQNKYTDELDIEIESFELDTGIKISEKESNQGEDSEIQNKNNTQQQNQGSDNSTSGNSGGSDISGGAMKE